MLNGRGGAASMIKFAIRARRLALRRAARGDSAALPEAADRRGTRAIVSQLYNAVEHTSDAVFITDREGRIEYVNPAFETMTGFTRAEAIGETPRLLKSGEQSDAYYRRLWSCVLSGIVFRDVVVNRKKSGELYHADQTITPMRDDDGHVTHFVSVLRDMTEQRRRQAQQIEIQLASRIQQRLFPAEAPRIPGCDFCGAVFPAAETCGDYYDFIPMPAGRFGVVVGDVCGHGFGPALLMAETRALLRAYCQVHHGLDAILNELNRSLESDMADHHYVTLLFAAVDLASRTLTYANAGHPSGYVLDAAGAVKAVLKSNGLPLGMFADSRYAASATIVLDAGDIVLLLTDGVSDGPLDGDRLAHEETILAAVRAHRDEPAASIVERIRDAARAGAGDKPQEDDITVVVGKIGPVPRT